MKRHNEPDEWPLDRELRYLESELGPFEDYGDWQHKHGANVKQRLGEDGLRLRSRINLIGTLLSDYDMTPEEAIACLEHEIEQYRATE